MNSFQLNTNKKLIFGAGERKQLLSLLNNYPDGPVSFFSGKSIASSLEGKELIDSVSKVRKVSHHIISGEPSPSLIDPLVEQCRKEKPSLIIGLGGGSVMDGAKAISAMTCEKGSVKDFLEGVGTQSPSGKKIPLIAMPTTSGTGSEATKNAVISDTEEGYKKSLRHDNFIPDIALVDPTLTISCPPPVTMACGFDTFCQLLESYLSTNASVLTDTLAFEGMVRHVKAFLPVCGSASEDIEARCDMSYASYLSGVTLANAGLGTVHGMGGPMGGLFDIPHGVACALLLKPVLEITFNKIAVKWQTEKWEIKVKRVARLLSGINVSNYKNAVDAILDTLDKWLDQFDLKPLGHYGIGEDDLGRIIVGSSNKNNPYELTVEEMETVLLSIR